MCAGFTGTGNDIGDVSFGFCKGITDFAATLATRVVGLIGSTFRVEISLMFGSFCFVNGSTFLMVPASFGTSSGVRLKGVTVSDTVVGGVVIFGGASAGGGALTCGGSFHCIAAGELCM